MPITKTLAQMRITLAKQAGIDTDDVGATIPRHPTTWVNTVLNDAYRSLRTFAVEHHFQLYKLNTAQALLPVVPPVTGETYAEVPWPQTATDILGIDVLVTGELNWRPLEPIEWEERRMFDVQSIVLDSTRAPYAFSAVSQGSVAAAVFTAGTIAVFPIPSTGSYKIWYLPEWVDITNDAHLFLFANEDWAQWMIWEATRRIATRDNDSQARLGEAARQLNPLSPDTVASRIVKSAPRHVKAGIQTMRRSPNY